MNSQSKYTLEYFNSVTGKRYHYSHLEGDLYKSTLEFHLSNNDVFKDEINPIDIMCLIENSGFRKGSFSEGAENIGLSRIIAVKGTDIPANRLTTFCIAEKESNMVECVVYLREKSEL